MPHQGWRNQSALLFTHSWRENNWIDTFPKGISAMWNAISFVQDLNSCRRVHFLYTSVYHHHHHVVPLARISLTLPRHFSLSFIASCRSSGLHPVSSHSCWMYVRAGRPAFARPYVYITLNNQEDFEQEKRSTEDPYPSAPVCATQTSSTLFTLPLP